MSGVKNPNALFYTLMARCEREIVKAKLEDHRWNRRLTAEHLGISYRALLYKIEGHGLKPNSVCAVAGARDPNV